MKAGVERVCAAVVWLVVIFAARVRPSEGGVEGNDSPIAVPGCALRESVISEADVAAEAFAFVLEDAAAARELEKANQEELVTRNGIRMTKLETSAKRRKEQRNTAGKQLYRRMLEFYLANVDDDNDDDDGEANHGNSHAQVNAATSSNDFLYDTTMCSSLDGPACKETRQHYLKSREASRHHHQDPNGTRNDFRSGRSAATTETQDEPRMSITNEDELLQLIANTIGDAVDEVVADRARDGDFLRELENIDVQELVDLALDVIAAVEADAEAEGESLDDENGDESQGLPDVWRDKIRDGIVPIVQ